MPQAKARATGSLTIIEISDLRPDNFDVSFDFSPEAKAIEFYLTAAVQRLGLSASEVAATKEAISTLFEDKNIIFS